MTEPQAPSNIVGMKDQVVGAAKETIGHLTGDKKMEIEGSLQHDKGTAQREASTSEKLAEGYGHQVQGLTKEILGSAIGDKKLEQEGKTEKVVGQTNVDNTAH
eukprot:TRINITY_DN4126_c0_g1_i2.p1 TRINITY_DN4126_c0_g1~~TRINITY_DN4126_c0_g1_i2.p1  ORF type:complete len:115 (-),score=43.59 TRINITY_DN4126_c0_g1_i2:4-312(-)